MDIRRVQMTGGSSYIITLPKEWIKSSHIKKNDPVGLSQQTNGTLLINPKITREGVQRSKEFKVNENTDQNELFRNLIGAYISGYNSIKINSKTRMPPHIRPIVRKFTQIVIGQEIVEETDQIIILKDLLNPAEMPFNRTIKRMHIIVKGMYEDALLSLINNDITVAQDVISRDGEIDRLHWLVARQYKIILRNVSFAEKIGTNINTAMTSFLISRIIERIGDHVVTIAKNVVSGLDSTLDKKILNSIKQAGLLSLESFSKSISSFFRKDLKSANENIESISLLRKKCEEINTQCLHYNLEGPTATSIGYIVESIRRIGEYAEDISENVINHLIGEDL